MPPARCGRRAAAAFGAVAFAVEGGAVGRHGVDLPGLAVGCALDPELVLLGATAHGALFFSSGEARFPQPGLLGFDRFGVGDFDAKVVQAAALAGVFQQDELEGSAMAKLAYPGRSLAGSVPNSLA
jgi:hypothetical protein